MLSQTHAAARAPGGRLRGLSAIMALSPEHGMPVQSMPRAMPTGRGLVIGEETLNQPERPGCHRPGGSVNDVPKAHELHLGSASGI